MLNTIYLFFFIILICSKNLNLLVYVEMSEFLFQEDVWLVQPGLEYEEYLLFSYEIAEKEETYTKNNNNNNCVKEKSFLKEN